MVFSNMLDSFGIEHSHESLLSIKGTAQLIDYLESEVEIETDRRDFLYPIYWAV